MAESQVKLARNDHVVFRGPREAAEEYLANNFPRVHVEPGVDYGDDGPKPDAYVVHPSEVPDDKDEEKTGGAFE